VVEPFEGESWGRLCGCFAFMAPDVFLTAAHVLKGAKYGAEQLHVLGWAVSGCSRQLGAR
jgi:V8-like Glu-specific endopeptidase